MTSWELLQAFVGIINLVLGLFMILASRPGIAYFNALVGGILLQRLLA